MKDSYLESKPIPEIALKNLETTVDVNKDSNLVERSCSPALVPCGAARVCPAKSLPRHLYLREDTLNSAETMKLQYQKRGYNCLCMSSIMPCRLCFASPPTSTDVSDILSAARLDHSYHASISYPHGEFLIGHAVKDSA